MFGEGIKLPNGMNADVGVALGAILAAGFAAAWWLIGPYEALRGFAVEALILAATFYVARQWLPWEDAPRVRIKQPRPEMFIALAGFAFFYVAWPLLSNIDDPVGMFLNTMFANVITGVLVITALIAFKYEREAWGLHWPTGRELLVLAGVTAISIGLSILFGQWLPFSEAYPNYGPVRPLMPGTFLWNLGAAQSTGSSLVPILLFIFLLSVTGQELFFRVYLQARLAHYLPGRWALFAQAAIFTAATLLPIYLLTNGTGLLPPPLLTQVAVLSNGILAGYFWRKTGSLPLLILLHVFAFSRWGL